MPSTPNLDISANYSAGAPAATDRVNATQLDSDHLAVGAWANEKLLPSLAEVIRDDDTLVDGIVRSRNLHPEVSLLIASKAGWQPKVDVQAASLANIVLTAPGATIDGRAMVSGDRFLAKNQTLASENGIYVWNGAAVAATRATDCDSASDLGYAFVSVAIDGGTTQVGTSWVCNQSASDIASIGVTSITFCQVGSDFSSQIMRPVITATTLAVARDELGVYQKSEVIPSTADITVTSSDSNKVISVSAEAAPRSVVLPSAATVGNGFRITIVKSDQSGNEVTINPVSGQRIGYDGPTFPVGNTSNNGSGKVRIRVSALSNGGDNRVFTTGEWVEITGVGGTTEANGVWQVTRVQTESKYWDIDLLDVTYANAYTSGGEITLLRKSLRLRVQDSIVTLVSDGLRWVIESGSTDATHWCRDMIIGHNVDYPGFDKYSNGMRRTDFMWDAMTLRLHLRSLILNETADPPELALRKSGGDDAVYPDGDLDYVRSTETIGLLHWTGLAHTDPLTFQSRSAQIYARAAEDISNTEAGGRLIFAVTPIHTGAGCVDAVEISSAGKLNVGTVTDSGRISSVEPLATGIAVWAQATHASYTGSLVRGATTKAGATDFNFIRMESNNGSDVEFMVRGDGQVFSDGGTAMSTPADYAEMVREWWDGNPSGEDRVGMSVVLVCAMDTNKVIYPGESNVSDTRIRLASTLPVENKEAIIGVVSGNPAIKGASAFNHWIGRYKTDKFGRRLKEKYQTVNWIEKIYTGGKTQTWEHIGRGYPVDAVPSGVVIPADAEYGEAERFVQNPDYDENAPYTPREERKEWDYIGLLGRLPLLTGQPVNPRWIMTGKLAEDCAEFLVR